MRRGVRRIQGEPLRVVFPEASVVRLGRGKHRAVRVEQDVDGSERGVGGVRRGDDA